MWGVAPRPGRDQNWDVQFDKERDRQVAGFDEKLTWHQPITTAVSRQKSWTQARQSPESPRDSSYTMA
jgi:hypothetical protein